MRCQVCHTDTPGGGPETICQHCGHQLGAPETVFDRLLGVIERLGRHTEIIARREAAIAQAIPQDQSFAVPFTIPAGGTLIQDLGAPMVGRVWEVRRAVSGGLTATTAAAGAFYLFRQGTPPTELNLVNLCDFSPTLPNVAFYGSHEFIVRGGEHLWGAFVNASAGQQYVAAIQVQDWDEAIYDNPAISEHAG